ncbi:hypothetical protein SPBR_06847 [Sporothrix brasiliensis 5110]|uniref:Uncharacterized protein n=1 Tax=Sporothrix brasiliensis 5110 TaxID=1398154 RepID=A0A0C2IUW2_9PEZI|nr:uncharacterized protein SPBR_06847 [Sporothrix brasiliensis 5110]KIH88777.1 hypothetical protein SPBR_06847 [Sporothrix brasiliensis 5110]
MADQPSETDADDVEYAIDGTEHSRDGYGNLVTVEEQREMLEEEERLHRAMKDMRAQREASVRAAFPVAFSIPQAVYTAASENPQQLSDADRARILARGDVHARALVSPRDLTQAERYRILGWPAPDVVEQRIRAATRPTGTELSTPAELFAKAERQGTDTLTPIERHLLGQGFRVEGSAFEDDDFSDEEQERANKKAKNVASTLFSQFGIPGNQEAYAAAGKEEGVNLQIVAAALMQSINAHSRKHAAKFGQPIPALWKAPGPSARYPLGQPPDQPAEASTGQPAEEPAEKPARKPAEEQEDESARVPEPARLPAEFLVGPGTPFFRRQLESSSAATQAGFGLPGQPPFQPPQWPGFGSGLPGSHGLTGAPGGLGLPGAPGGLGLPGAPGASTTSSPGVQEGQAASDGPGPAEAAGILEEITKALLYIHGARRAKHMGRDEFDDRFNSIVASIHGLADRFNAAAPPAPPHPFVRGLPRSQITLPPPRRVLGPNPFGLRLSHDGNSVSSADRNVTRDNEPPRWSTQVAPRTIWSATIPHRMMEPSRRGMAIDEFITSIQTWTDKEEAAWRNYRAARAAARGVGQEAEPELEPEAQPPLFFHTPPGWPMSSSSEKPPFIVYYESVQDTDAAKAWPSGAIQYAKHKWDAMTDDEKAVYATLCEDQRRQAWIETFRFPRLLR